MSWGACRTAPGTATLKTDAAVVATANAPTQLEAELRACVDRKIIFPTLDQAAEDSLNGVYEAFASGDCSGCHNSGRSTGGLGHFSVTGLSTDDENRAEFFKGLAIRHFRTRDIVQACFKPGPAQAALMKALTNMRTGVSGGLRFFEHGTDAQMHELAMHFLQGGFEVPSEQGEPQHDALFDWFKNGGGNLPKESHIKVLLEMIRLNGLDRPTAMVPVPLQVVTEDKVQ